MVDFFVFLEDTFSRGFVPEYAKSPTIPAPVCFLYRYAGSTLTLTLRLTLTHAHTHTHSHYTHDSQTH